MCANSPQTVLFKPQEYAEIALMRLIHQRLRQEGPSNCSHCLSSGPIPEEVLQTCGYVRLFECLDPHDSIQRWGTPSLHNLLAMVPVSLPPVHIRCNGLEQLVIRGISNNSTEGTGYEK